MRKIFVVFLLIMLAGCEKAAVKSTSAIQTETQLSSALKTPVQIPVAFYVDRSEPEKGINFIGKLEEVTEMVSKDMFVNAEKLSADSDFQYLLHLKAVSTWDRVWGGWDSNLDLTVINRQGKTIYTGSIKQGSGGGGLYDINAVHNSLAKAVKESLIGFLNTRGASTIAEDISNYQSHQTPLAPIKELLSEVSAESSGTGFFINQTGEVMTAAHVVEECIFVEVQHKGKTLLGEVLHSSTLLDLAVIKTDFQNSEHVSIGKKTVPTLGKQVFVTGFPLSGILSDYPSLTVGNISSLGGLKGGQGHFQFSAPIQPGNSGGAIVDYQGNLIGLVSSSLNQKMMLEKAGTTSQNVNFGIELALMKRYLDKHNISYKLARRNTNFEKASASAVEYTNQVLCYN